MLTADLVRARRRKGELVLVSLEGDDREEALYLAGAFTDLAKGAVGRPRAELDEAMGQIEAPPHLQRVADGLKKLIEDRCDFEATLDLPPEEIRREVFRRAAEVRRSLAPGETFDRAAVLADVAGARNLDPGVLERGLYADLRGAHVLRAFEALPPEALLGAYDDAQAQAVLLRAVRVRAEVRCGAAWGYRQLFAKLKFLRLLHSIEPLDGGGYRVEVDGPFSLFESVTKYGLQLALSLPAIQACASWSVEADVRWGKTREALVFKLAGRGPDRQLDGEALALPPEVEAFRQGFEALKSPWRASPSPAILNLPGVGLCVPDLVFERPKGPKVYFEVLGYWSREAVWRRVDLVRQGLGVPLLVAVSERLRVSEEVLGDDPSGALYVYKGALSPRVVLKRLDARWGGAAGETLPLPVAPAGASRAVALAEAPLSVALTKAASAASVPSPKGRAKRNAAVADGEAKRPAAAPDGEAKRPAAAPAGETERSAAAPNGKAKRSAAALDGQLKRSAAAPDKEAKHAEGAPEGGAKRVRAARARKGEGGIVSTSLASQTREVGATNAPDTSKTASKMGVSSDVEGAQGELNTSSGARKGAKRTRAPSGRGGLKPQAFCAGPRGGEGPRGAWLVASVIARHPRRRRIWCLSKTRHVSAACRARGGRPGGAKRAWASPDG